MIAQQVIQESIETKKYLLEEAHKIEHAAHQIRRCYNGGGKLLIFGNGGSAADAQHIAGELVGRFKKERKALAAIALTTDSSILTAVSNDYHFERIFERQVEALAQRDDVLFGISTSGKSRNVVKAFEMGRKLGTYNISLTGNDGGDLMRVSDLNINVKSNSTPRIQESHMLAYHIICEIVEEEMFK